MSPQQSIESHSEKSAIRMINMRILEKSELDIDSMLAKNTLLVTSRHLDGTCGCSIKARKYLHTG